jgi:hypothetical protein
MLVFDPSVLVRTMNWVDALQRAVDGVHSIDVSNVGEEVLDNHEKASTGVDEVGDHIDHVEDHARVASGE